MTLFASPYALANKSKTSVLDHTTFQLYSQTYYDSRFEGATNETRLRANIKTKHLTPYFGVNFSHDLSDGRSPQLIEDIVSPTLGTQFDKIPFISLFLERRWHHQYKSDKREIDNKEMRYGAFIYHYHKFNFNLFSETYGEMVVVDRVDNRPVTTIWSKLGFRYRPNQWFRQDFYSEGFTRISPNLGYGPDQNDLRLGSRVAILYQYWAVSLSAYYIPLSNINKDGLNTLLVISREVF